MSRKFMLLAGVSTALVATPAFAQDAPAQAAPAGEQGGLEEIIVTAQKRQERLQDVPVSVTAVGAEQLENQRITEFGDLTRAASSLTVTQTTSAPNNAIILRGIGTFAFSIGVEPSVAVILDDLPVVQQAQAFDGLSDVARIEVLKGPQGTLFGKNASAGVVNIVTKDPGKETSGSFSLTAATDGDYRGEASISTPFGDNGSGVRLSGFYHDYRGNVRNLTLGRRVNDQENYGLRAKAKLVLSDVFNFTLNGSWSKAKQSGTAVTIRSIDPLGTPRVTFGAPPLAGLTALNFLPSLTGITPGINNYNARTDAAAGTTNKIVAISGRAVYELDQADIISVTGFQDWKFNFQNDVDGTDVNVLAVAAPALGLNGGVVQSGPYHSKLFTQELRVVSTGSGPFKYLFGLFYADATTDRAFLRGPGLALANWDATATNKGIGAFGQVDYKLESGTTLTAGIRANREKIGVRFANLLTPSAAQAASPAALNANCFVANNPGCKGTNTDSVVTWKGSIAQEVANNVMVYASVARGYKGFAYDVTTGFNPARVNAALAGTGLGLPGVGAAGLIGNGPVKPETSTSYELGLKSRFLDNKVQLNVVGYLTNYNNFQAQSAVIIGGAPQFVLNNVGKLRTKGVEVELSAKPADWLRLDASAAYTDAVMVSFPVAQNFSDQTGAVFSGGASSLVGNCIAAPAATAAAPRSRQNRSGARLPNSPKFKYNLNATGEFPFGDDNKALVTLGYQHQGKVNFDLLGNPLLTERAYGIFNASVGAELANGFKATLFVTNLFDTHYAASLQDGFGTLNGNATNPAHVIYQFQPRDSERFFGVKLGYSF
jgi:iron complex outermembrane receptor protein